MDSGSQQPVIIDVDSEWITAICTNNDREAAGPVRRRLVPARAASGAQQVTKPTVITHFRKSRSFVSEDYAHLFIPEEQLAVLKRITEVRNLKDTPPGCTLRGAITFHGMMIARYVINATANMPEKHVVHGFLCGPTDQGKPTQQRLRTNDDPIITNEFMRLLHERKDHQLSTRGGNAYVGIVSTTFIGICQGQ